MTSTPDSEADLSRDAFLGGRVMAWQPRRGYRAAIDPVLLAAAVAARPGQSVLDLGCGVGVAALCLWARVPGLALTGVEVQPGYAALAARNAAAMGAALRVVTADLTDLPADLRARAFDEVMMNPPYHDRAASPAARDAGRDLALAGPTPLSDWIATAARRLVPGGWLTLVQRAARLPEVLGAVEGRLGSVAVRPVAPRMGREAKLVLVRARKGGRAAFRLLPPLVLHEGDRHPGDRDHFTPEAAAILRGGAALSWTD
jgi:tRNA1(Val) A37 N6-methylase TrmN6